jgi:hypothetical protein
MLMADPTLMFFATPAFVQARTRAAAAKRMILVRLRIFPLLFKKKTVKTFHGFHKKPRATIRSAHGR